MFAPVDTIASTMLFRSRSMITFCNPAEINEPASLPAA